MTGVACITVAPLRRKTRSNSAPTVSCSRAITSRAPTINGRKTSSAAMSNAMVVTLNSVSPACNPGFSRIAHSRLTNERWRICTPFGNPVEPEV